MRYAATALARLSKDHEATQSAIAAAGAIAPLVALLDGKEGPEAQESAAGAILALAALSLQARLPASAASGGFALVLALVLTALAGLAKETGFTLYGVLVVAEALRDVRGFAPASRRG